MGKIIANVALAAVSLGIGGGGAYLFAEGVDAHHHAEAIASGHEAVKPEDGTSEELGIALEAEHQEEVAFVDELVGSMVTVVGAAGLALTGLKSRQDYNRSKT